MVLKLIKKRNIKGICFIKKYEYGKFNINVNIDESGISMIDGTDELGEISLSANGYEDAILTINTVMVSSEQELEGFISRLQEAREIIHFVNSRRDEILNRED